MIPFGARPLLLSSCLFLAPSVPGAPALPEGPRLRDIAGDRVVVSGLMGWGAHFPLDGGDPGKADNRLVLEREFNGGTALCYPKHTGAWVAPGVFDLSRFNDSVDWLHARGMAVTAHLLVGPAHYYPDWFVDGDFTAEELERKLEDFIRVAMTENDNGRKVRIWNVVNEALHGDRPRDANHFYRKTPWDKLGWEPDASGLPECCALVKRHPVWIRKAFEFARKYTDGRLEYRDNNCEFPAYPHFNAVYQRAAHLRNLGTPLDAVGHQAHLDVRNTYDWEGFTAGIRRLRALGVEVYLTEVDVRYSTNSAEDRARQHEHLYNLVKAGLAGGANMINFWGVLDGRHGSKADDNFHSNLFEDARASGGGSYDPKPAYHGVQKALLEARAEGIGPFAPGTR